jgi:hypothetical protein
MMVMEKVELITTKIGGWDAIVSLEDTPKGRRVIISYLGKGGGIVSATSYEEAEKLFIKSMKLSEMIRKFWRYSSLKFKN